MTERMRNVLARIMNSRVRAENAGLRMGNAHARALGLPLTGPVTDLKFEGLLTEMEHALTATELSCTRLEQELTREGV